MWQRRAWIGTITIAWLLLAVPPSDAILPCNGVVLTIDPLVTEDRLYIDDRGGDGIWFYLEDNDRGGLQSGGSLLFITDTCRQGNDTDRLVATFPLGV